MPELSAALSKPGSELIQRCFLQLKYLKGGLYGFIPVLKSTAQFSVGYPVNGLGPFFHLLKDSSKLVSSPLLLYLAAGKKILKQPCISPNYSCPFICVFSWGRHNWGGSNDHVFFPTASLWMSLSSPPSQYINSMLLPKQKQFPAANCSGAFVFSLAWVLGSYLTWAYALPFQTVHGSYCPLILSKQHHIISRKIAQKSKKINQCARQLSSNILRNLCSNNGNGFPFNS